jgi:hypothetical protein
MYTQRCVKVLWKYALNYDIKMIEKTFFLGILIVMVFSVITFGNSDSFGILLEMTILEQYQKNEIILIGSVESLIENPSKGVTEYEINVEKFMKNPQSSSTLFVMGTGAQSSEIHLSIEQIFNVGDRVFLFLNESDGQYQISPYSFNALTFNPDEEFLLAPLTLYRAGISSDDIVCRNNLELVLKASNDYPACVTSDTKIKLVERGWTLL